MNSVDIASCTADTLPLTAELVRLYDSVGWSAYTREPEALQLGIRGSLHVVTARQDGLLVGLARVIGDGATICYLQDVLVDPTVQRTGLGRELVARVFEPFAHVRQHVLMTDEEPGQKAFYEALGFAQLSEDAPGRAFVRFQG